MPDNDNNKKKPQPPINKPEKMPEKMPDQTPQRAPKHDGKFDEEIDTGEHDVPQDRQ